MMQCLRRLLADSSGGTLVEYTLIIALVAAVAVLAVMKLGSNNSSILSSAAQSI
jgi:Flp pilus assembly pilin Flp